MKAKVFLVITVVAQIAFISVIILKYDSLLSLGSCSPSRHSFVPSNKPQSSAKPCLFIISTSQSNRENIFSQFASYNGDPSVGLWLNVYDSVDNNNTDKIFTEGESIVTSYIPGLKPTLWERVKSPYTDQYKYLYFLDDDMLFDKALFSFDQFRWIVQRTDAIIASPKIIRRSAPVVEKKTPSGGNLLHGKQINAILKHRRHRRLLEQNGRGWGLDPLGLYREETTFDKMAGKAKVVEIGSFMFKTDAWDFFRDNIFVPSKTSDCGPDCVWCRIFEQEEGRFGKIPCVRALHVGIIHLDTKSYGGGRNFSDHSQQCKVAVENYFAVTEQKYGMKNQFLLQCRDKSMEFISLEQLSPTDPAGLPVGIWGGLEYSS